MTKRTLAIALLLPFSALSLYVVYQVGYMGIVEYQLRDPAGWQVLADLVVALVLVFAWLIPAARKAGRNPWPWVIATVLLGSFGPLFYLLSDKAAEQPG